VGHPQAVDAVVMAERLSAIAPPVSRENIVLTRPSMRKQRTAMARLC
jgi:hypothetical protein